MCRLSWSVYSFIFLLVSHLSTSGVYVCNLLMFMCMWMITKMITVGIQVHGCGQEGGSGWELTKLKVWREREERKREEQDRHFGECVASCEVCLAHKSISQCNEEETTETWSTQVDSNADNWMFLPFSSLNCVLSSLFVSVFPVLLSTTFSQSSRGRLRMTLEKLFNFPAAARAPHVPPPCH